MKIIHFDTPPDASPEIQADIINTNLCNDLTASAQRLVQFMTVAQSLYDALRIAENLLGLVKWEDDYHQPEHDQITHALEDYDSLHQKMKAEANQPIKHEQIYEPKK